jgi:hypothetical protein
MEARAATGQAFERRVYSNDTSDRMPGKDAGDLGHEL